jgi:hypothetical protein
MLIMSITTGGKPCQKRKQSETIEDILDRIEEDIQSIRDKNEDQEDEDDDSFDDEDEEEVSDSDED